MKIIDGIRQLRGAPVEIPDCGRDDLPGFFKEMGYQVGVEIGVLRGEYTEKLCQAGLKVYGIDPWMNYRNYRRHPREEPHEDLLRMAAERLQPYDCVLLRKTSMEALNDFADNSLDFAYIDGNHTIRYVVEDIYEWNRKVRPGGAICGHDYARNARGPYSFQALHVKYGVDLMTRILGVPDWFILGEYHGEVRDKWRSWLWIKP